MLLSAAPSWIFLYHQASTGKNRRPDIMGSLADTNIMTSNLVKVVEHLCCIPVLERQVTPQALPFLIRLAIAFLLNMIQIPHHSATGLGWRTVVRTVPGDTASSRRRIPATTRRTGKREGQACSGGSDATHDDESRYGGFGDKTKQDAAFDPKSKTENNI
jgi:hypothetical protein